MKSQSWETIRQSYENLPHNLHAGNARRIEGFQYVFNLIPYLKQSQVLNSGIRFLSHYCLVFMVTNKTAKVIIAPPGPIFTGSNTEFCVFLYDEVSNKKLLVQQISFLFLDRIVDAAESYFLRLQKDQNIS